MHLCTHVYAPICVHAACSYTHGCLCTQVDARVPVCTHMCILYVHAACSYTHGCPCTQVGAHVHMYLCLSAPVCAPSFLHACTCAHNPHQWMHPLHAHPYTQGAKMLPLPFFPTPLPWRTSAGTIPSGSHTSARPQPALHHAASPRKQDLQPGVSAQLVCASHKRKKQGKKRGKKKRE